LNPKITIWNTSADGKGSFDGIRDLARAIPPIIETITDQTNI